MTPLIALAVLVVLLLTVTALGLVLQRSQGRARSRTDAAIGAIELDDLGRAEWGSVGTVVQFSTEFCARCPGVQRTLTDLTAARTGVDFVHVDVTHRPELASKYRLLQTPVVFLVDRNGTTRTRLGGALARQSLVTELDSLIGAAA